MVDNRSKRRPPRQEIRTLPLLLLLLLLLILLLSYEYSYIPCPRWSAGRPIIQRDSSVMQEKGGQKTHNLALRASTAGMFLRRYRRASRSSVLPFFSTTLLIPFSHSRTSCFYGAQSGWQAVIDHAMRTRSIGRRVLMLHCGFLLFISHSML